MRPIQQVDIDLGPTMDPGHGNTKVVINGTDYAGGIASLCLEAAVGEITTVTLSIPVPAGTHATGEAFVKVSGVTAALLKEIGWVFTDLSALAEALEQLERLLIEYSGPNGQPDALELLATIRHDLKRATR